MKRINRLAAIAAMALALSAQAEVTLEARHTLVSLDVVAGGSVLTVDYTLRNTGDEALAGITVKPAGIVYSSPGADSLSIASLHPGTETTTRWVLHTSQTEQLEQLGAYVGASMNATTAAGAPVELSIGSKGSE